MLKLAQNKRVKISGDIELKDRLVGVQRVVKVTKGGRAFGFSAIVVVGDEQSIVGIGLGKSKDVATAIQKAIESAKKNLVKILDLLNKGSNISLVSDAGTPSISDPGVLLIRECLKNNIEVIPAPGPSAVMAPSAGLDERSHYGLNHAFWG